MGHSAKLADRGKTKILTKPSYFGRGERVPDFIEIEAGEWAPTEDAQAWLNPIAIR